MRGQYPHLHQVLGLCRGEVSPLAAWDDSDVMKYITTHLMSPSSPMVVVTVGRPRLRLRDFTTGQQI